MKDRIFVRELTGLYGLKEELNRLRSANRVIRGDSVPFKGGPKMWNKDLLHPGTGLTQTLHVHEQVLGPGGKSKKHGHQNEAMFYILEGKGYEVHDGVKFDWQAGDLVVVENSCVHQHFNASTSEHCRIIVMKTKPIYLFLNLMFQGVSETSYPDDGEEAVSFNPDQRGTCQFREKEVWTRGDKSATYYADAVSGIIRKDSSIGERKRKILHPEDMPWEICAQGKIKHLINEKMDVKIHGHDAYIQIIPTSGHSGKHRHMWEEVIYVLDGKGYDLHWDVHAMITDTYNWYFDDNPQKYPWQTGDIIYVPANTIHQHFNETESEDARMIVASARVYRHLGFKEIEQIEGV